MVGVAVNLMQLGYVSSSGDAVVRRMWAHVTFYGGTYLSDPPLRDDVRGQIVHTPLDREY